MEIKKMMMCSILSLALAAVPVFAMGQSSSDAAPKTEKHKDGKIVEITGTVRLVGNMPFTEIVITDADGNDWFVTSEDKEKFILLQQQKIHVKGAAYYTDMILADNRKVGVRKTLKNIVIIK